MKGLRDGLTLLIACLFAFTPALAPTPAVAATALPDHLVNGDFEYPAHVTDATAGSQVTRQWTAVDPNRGTAYTGCDHDSWTPIPGFDRTLFAWSSTQTDGTVGNCGVNQRRAGAVEIQQDDDGNQYAELAAAQANTSIYQDIATKPGAVYRIRLKHASLNRNWLDKMRVLVGAPGHETPVTMTRTVANGNGDRVGEQSTVIASKAVNTTDRNHAGQWETYEGVYQVPQGQTVTRYTFESVSSRWSAIGNILDDITFQVAYPLAYDANDGEGTLPQQP